MEAWSLRPFLVVIIITPLAPRAPYNAAEAASFKTVSLSISAGLREFISPSKGTPSRIINGALPELIELIPLMRMAGDDPPGCPDWRVICTPDTFPRNASTGLVTCTLDISSSFSTPAEPVNADFLAVPYATTITSSMLFCTGIMTMRMLLFAVTSCDSIPTYEIRSVFLPCGRVSLNLPSMSEIAPVPEPTT